MKIDFTHIDSVRISTFLRPRVGEVKVGERIVFANDNIEESLKNFSGDYILLGIEEDIGPRANHGLPGAINAFKSFLGRFLNMQVNEFVDIDKIMILGRIKAETLETGFAKRRQDVQDLDAFVEEILVQIFKHGKIPIVVGGGHNNAYPLMRAWFRVHKQKIDVINLDAHADFRPMEGRHSGNAFSYASHEGFLNSYTVLGLHKAYNGASMLASMREAGVQFTFFEDYLFNHSDLMADTQKFLDARGDQAFGVELDLDCIAFMPTSAYTASGWHLNEARKWLSQLTSHKKPKYVNITEGACDLNTWSDSILGKSLAYLVSDLISK
jgi:formiminoglutamase